MLLLSPALRRFSLIGSTAILVFGLLQGCSTTAAVPADAKVTTLSFRNLDCSGCGDEMAESLSKQPGVYKVTFSRKSAELAVVAAPNVEVLGLAQKLKPQEEEWSLVQGAGQGTYVPWQAPQAGADVKTVAEAGEDVPDLKVHLVAGKVTVMDFGAKWCEPCRELDAALLTLVAQRTDVAYRKLDVVDWDSPLGQRYMKGVKALPYVIVFDKQGREVDRISGLDIARTQRAIEQGAK